MTSTKTHPRDRVARNFIKRYGMTRFREMIAAFEENRSGAEIGKMLGVSRERVRQWRNTFGMTVTFYRLYPETKRLLNGGVE
jgi:hypothetical protein